MAQFGKVAVGAAVRTITNYEYVIAWNWPQVPGAGTINFARIHCNVVIVAGINQLRLHVYNFTGVLGTSTIAFSSGIVNVVNMAPAWVTLPMAGVLAPAQQYIIVVQGFNNNPGRLRTSMDAAPGWGQVQLLADIDFNPPANLAGAVNNNPYDSAYVDYTPGGAGPVGSPGVDIKRRMFNIFQN